MGNKVQKTCYFDSEFFDMVEQRRIINRRSFSEQIQYDLLTLYNKQLEADRRALAMAEQGTCNLPQD